MRLATVNVVVVDNNGVLLEIHSFTNDENGEKEAKEAFGVALKEYTDMTDEEIKEGSGSSMISQGEYTVYFWHSKA